MEENQLNDLSQNSGEEIKGQAKSAMILGILGLALSFIPVLGIVLGIMALKKQAGPREAIIASNFQIPGRGLVVTAKICGIAAIPASIFWTVYILGIVVMLIV
ncbi:MAG: hypothetical protein GY754_02155 [bacterium]|nr:hypothetical protein [bacterium]